MNINFYSFSIYYLISIFTFFYISHTKTINLFPYIFEETTDFHKAKLMYFFRKWLYSMKIAFVGSRFFYLTNNHSLFEQGRKKFEVESLVSYPSRQGLREKWRLSNTSHSHSWEERYSEGQFSLCSESELYNLMSTINTPGTRLSENMEFYSFYRGVTPILKREAQLAFWDS